MNVFGMVTTRHSHTHTVQALSSFGQTTDLGSDDLFFLIDNDGTWDAAQLAPFPRVQLLTQATPLGFAANVNQVMRRARDHRADLFFLNNDLIFTPHWLKPLQVNLPVLLSPVSNFQIPFRDAAWECGPFLDLPDYLDHQDAFRSLVQEHQRVVRGYQPALAVPFFAIKIPYAVSTAVGFLDETFGPGGGEDVDYCLRCHLAGCRVQFALDSYLLHFMGKSTWRGAETAEQRRQREQTYLRVFRNKWGRRLLDLVCLGKPEAWNGDSAVEEQPARGNFRGLIERLLAREEARGGPLRADRDHAAGYAEVPRVFPDKW